MTDWKIEWRPLAIIGVVFIAFYFLPFDRMQLWSPISEALLLTQWYAREHVLLCLIPAFFIAGAIGAFVSQASVMKYLGPKAGKVVSYGVASVSGSILAVCSCTILPLFAGIYRMGAGLGPAIAFLYAGPAINVLAIILTARVLGMELGIARAVGAIVFSVVIGLFMHLIYRKEEIQKANSMVMPESVPSRGLAQNGIYFAILTAILVFANWGHTDDTTGIWYFLYTYKWLLTSIFGILLGIVLIRWFAVAWWKIVLTLIPAAILGLLFPQHPALGFFAAVFGLSVITSTSSGETGEWFNQSWDFAKKIMPLLFYGVLIAGLLLGRPGHEGIMPSGWIASAVGGNSLAANLFASVAGAFMYFATLTEVPILQGLIGNGMGKGPALALLLAGPALSLPNMLVIRSVIGTKKTIVYVSLVIIMSTVCGIIYGMLA